MHYQRIKAIQANTPQQLERQANTFIEQLERAPISINFETSYIFYEGDPYPHARYNAYITYILNETGRE